VRPGFLLFQNTVVVVMKRRFRVKPLLVDLRSISLELMFIFERNTERPNVVIFGQKGGPSTNSMTEASMVSRWSSVLLEGQMVRPRPSSGCQRLDPVVRGENPSILLSDLGGNASSSPAMGDRGAPVLDCIFYFLSRVLFMKCKGPSSNYRFPLSKKNYRFFRTNDEKGIFCNMYLSRVDL
jgi:hypothetical protein